MDTSDLSSLIQELKHFNRVLTKIINTFQLYLTETISTSSDTDSSTQYMPQESDSPQPFVCSELRPNSNPNKSKVSFCKNHRHFGTTTVNCKGNCSFEQTNKTSN